MDIRMNLPAHITPNEREAVEQAVRSVVAKHSTRIRFIALFGSKARALPLSRPGFFANLRRDAIELWRRPGTENPLRLPEPALAH